ncbi:MAG: adenosylcobalamin-dependent ribonucleoside-diphosphate reductase [Gammaproteobacteria bacterium]
MDRALATEISRHVWETKYRARHGEQVLDRRVEDTWHRVARALAAVEPGNRQVWEQRFYSILDDFRFLPGGRILAGAGTDRRITLFNCFVMGRIEDSMDGIFDALKEGALTMQQGGGVGYDFSTLRPRGEPAHSVGTVASGPVSFMAIWDAMCDTLLSTGARRGAMMATLRCDHPDILEFVEAKRKAGFLRHFNLSVQVTDCFMEAVRDDREWLLVYPESQLEGIGGEQVERRWPGHDGPVPCRVLRKMRARELWGRIMRGTYEHAEPGVLFVDRINHLNNLWYREHITATNPCGEIPLPPYGACDLGSINLTRFVREPFTERARLDMDGIAHTAGIAVRLLDNVIDASRFPLPRQKEQAHGSRRIGLGITGLADALIMLGHDYRCDAARSLAGQTMERICDSAYRMSIELAREKGAFPYFQLEHYLEGAFVKGLPTDIREGIAEAGIRNSHLLAIAPTGTVSLLADNVSSGIEPVFEFSQRRKVIGLDGEYREFALEDYAFAQWRRLNGPDAALPATFVGAAALDPSDHLAMQAALQPHVDNSISKTINIPEELPFERFKAVYMDAYLHGLKGCTTFRPNPVTGAILEAADPRAGGVHCCSIEREAD